MQVELNNYFKCKIDKSILKELSQKSDIKGLLHVSGYFIILFTVGFVAYYTWGTYWSIFWFLVYGNIYNFVKWRHFEKRALCVKKLILKKFVILHLDVMIKEKTTMLKDGQKKEVTSWDGNCLNIYTRNGDSVKVENHYWFGKSREKIMSYSDFVKWQLDVQNTNG